MLNTRWRLVLPALLAVLVLGLAACGGDDSDSGDSAGAGESIVADLAEQNGSGMSGTATLTETGEGQMEIVLALEGDDGSAARPVHIHAGTCDELGDVVFGMSDVQDGASTSTVDGTFADLEGDFVINAHESADAIENYVACGSLG